MNGFTFLSEFYDELSDKEFYDSYLQFILAAIERYSSIKVGDILDLACGSGLLSKRLHEKGYGMVCVDSSTEMLNKAREACDGLLLLNQPMTEFELYGTVQATICTLDSLNYLDKPKQLEKTFKSVANYTENGGLFIFDINTKYRYEQCYGDKSFVFENENGVLVWQNYYEAQQHTMELMYFFLQDNGQYKRFDEIQYQRYFPPKIIEKLLLKCGFEIIGCYGTTDFGPIEKNSEKYYYITRRNILQGEKPNI